MKLAPSLRALRVAPPNESLPEAAALRARPSLRRQAWSRGPQPYRGQHQRPGRAGSAVFWPFAAPVSSVVKAPGAMEN